MSFSQKVLHQCRPTAALALPLIAGHLSHMLTMVADTLMIGELGAVPLAAATFAGTLLHLPLMLGIGLATAVSIRVSQARGADQPDVARSVLRHGLYMGIAAAFVILFGSLVMLPAFPFFRQEVAVIEASRGYFILVAFSFVPLLGSVILKNHADAMNRPWPPFWILLAGVFMNIWLNWLLIYGNGGLPAWGLEGAGVATLLSRVATFLGLFAWCRLDCGIRDWVPRRIFSRPNMTELKDLWSLGWPASIQIMAEVSAFVMATMMIGSLGAKALASHQVAISCAATIYMFPLGLSQALTVRIGAALGAQAFDRMRPILFGGWLMGVLFTVISASSFLLFNQDIAGWFLDRSPAHAIAASLLTVAAAFQLSDAVQIISLGALRGLSDVRRPALVAFLASWTLSLPIGGWLMFGLDMGVRGMWWGMTVGLTTVALTMGYRAWRKTAYLPEKTQNVQMNTNSVQFPN